MAQMILIAHITAVVEGGWPSTANPLAVDAALTARLQAEARKVAPSVEIDLMGNVHADPADRALVVGIDWQALVDAIMPGIAEDLGGP